MRSRGLAFHVARKSSILLAAGGGPAAIKERVLSELRARMSHAMCLRGMAARAQEAYIGALVELAKYYHRSPVDLGLEGSQTRLPALNPRGTVHESFP